MNCWLVSKSTCGWNGRRRTATLLQTRRAKTCSPVCDQPTERGDCVFSQVGIECSFTCAELVEAQEHLGFNTGLTLGFIKYIYKCNTLVYKVYWCNPGVTWWVCVGVFSKSRRQQDYYINNRLSSSWVWFKSYLLKSIWNHSECGSNQIPVYLFVFRFNLTHVDLTMTSKPDLTLNIS